MNKFDSIKRLLTSALGRIAIFLFVAMPIVFYSCMALGGLMMSYLADWEYERGFDFMASAITGGAIVFPADPPTQFLSKVFASSAASCGIGIFGFTVALLSNSLVDPLVQVMGLEVEASELQEAANVGESANASDSFREIGKIIGKLGLLAMVFMVANIIGAALFGSVLGYMQGWDTWTAFKTMASVELGGGVQFHGMGKVTAEGQIVYVTVGVWSIGMATLMVAIAGAPGSQIVGQALGIQIDSSSPSSEVDPRKAAWAASKTLIFLVFTCLPWTLLLVMFAVACIMAPLTSWTFTGAFWAALPAVSGGAAALSSSTNPPLTTFGAIILICAASAGFFLLSLMIGLGGELLNPIILHPIFEPYLGRERSVGHSVLALVCISGVLIPTLVFCGSLLVGGFMALVQQWEFFQGFWWCVAVQLGGGMALTGARVDSFAGMLFGTVCVAWSIGVSILAIGVSGAPVVVPLMHALGMTIDPEELRSIAGSMSPKLKKNTA